MLTHLLIKNYALIEHLELKPDKELNIITGETGAGKSIMLGAIGLMLGNRADNKALFDTDEKCVIEGNFDVSVYKLKSFFEEEELDYDDTCIIRREISPSGKSRAFINDTPVNLETLKKIGSQLMDIHSQHDTLLLGSNIFQLSIVDNFAGNQKLIQQYKNLYKQFRKKEDIYRNLRDNASSAKKELDYHSFLLTELSEAKLERDEQERVEEELNLLENAEEVKIKLNAALEYLSNAEFSAIEGLRSAMSNLGQISNLSKPYEILRERTESCLIELKDIVSEIEREEMNVEVDPAKVDQLQDRLSTIYSLQQKHQVKTVEELLSIQAELAAKVSKVLNLDEEIEQARIEAEKSYQEMLQTAQKLSRLRQEAIPGIEQDLKQLLAELGMPNASVKITHQEIKPGADGIDEIHFLFTANKGVKPQELKNVASGGEFSRLMLCVKYILASKTSLPTIIFDEIDTGVSGEIAIKMGKMLKDMAHNHQVIVITHLHQIASRGEAHYFVYKDTSTDRTITRIKRLTQQGRINEIARIIGGEPPSASAIRNAKEFLEY
ncbi:DNA repair protein RecN [Rhodocytophaga aerolata]|uniref:DNA repair protein RecN n=1 Tax=Rhodocytophaga aerolata TaxID=455078 RepID=A0ABT8R8L6_9BACT|nr:DNA repair protein RecN [Rhodocytophaga aerolata]MDO1448309.1 DNA repair protein RecN [Rhodocytophaga aerolata]